MAKFSIVIATYNRAHLVPRALHSVLVQSYEDFQIVVVDDGSTDGTKSILAAFSDPRLEVISLSSNQGVSAAKNIGIKRSLGDFITILDSDDEFLPGFLSELERMTLERRSRIGVYFTNRIRVLDSHDGEKILDKSHFFVPETEDLYLYFLQHRPAGTGFGTTFSRNTLEEVGYFDEDLESAIDKDLLLRIFREGYRCVVSPKHLHKIHLHDGPRITSNRSNKARSYTRIYAKHSDTLTEHRSIAAAAYSHLASLYYSAGDLESGIWWSRRALRYAPFKLKLWAKFVLFRCESMRA